MPSKKNLALNTPKGGTKNYLSVTPHEKNLENGIKVGEESER